MKDTNYADVIRKHYPEDLKSVALLLYALPPTQCSVERLFSMVKYIKSDIRNRLNEESIDAVLYLRANKCITINA